MQVKVTFNAVSMFYILHTGKQFRVVIINTVRTLPTISRMDDPDTEYYLGFLSDKRQLNTAFTRAQSLVIVVGNPISLCSIGECCTVWKKYIKECEQNQSLYPQGTAYTDIKLDISTATTILNPDAVSFIPPAGSLNRPIVGAKEDDLVGEGKEEDATEEGAVVNEGVLEENKESDDDEIDFNTDDIILKELCRQIRKDRRRLDGEDIDSSDAEDDTEDIEQIIHDMQFSMVDEDDHVRFVPHDDQLDEPKSLGTGKILRCIFRMDIDGRRYAIPSEVTDEIKEVHIGNHTQRGTAMDGDEVSVELLPNDDAEMTNPTEQVAKTYGKVVSVEKRAVDLTGKELVCLADPFSDNIMVPVNRRLPKIVFILPGGKAKKIEQSPGHLVIPVCRLAKHGKNRAIRVRDVIVRNQERPHKLFKVKWLQWNTRFHYPLGIVIDDLPPCDNETEGLKILKEIHNVHDQDVSTDLCGQYPQDWRIPEDEYRRRTDLRNFKTFTVDSPDTQDIDDALSVDKLPSGEFQVGIHIADVAYFVRDGTALDKKARKMATSFYPAFGNAIHMLPTRLSSDLCSLLLGRDRLAISVFLNLDESGNSRPNQVRIERSIVCVKAQLTYASVEKMIEGSEVVKDQELQNCLSCLSRLAWNRRKARLGSARFTYYDGSSESMLYPQAHTLVEEMMILANTNVAQFLMARMPHSTPLRRQLPPAADEFGKWREDNARYIKQSPSLSLKEKFLLTDIQRNSQDDRYQEDGTSTIRVLNEVWQEMIKICATQDHSSFLHRIAGFLCSDQYHPQLSSVHSALYRLLQPGEYINSGTPLPEDLKHSSLRLDAYTHFTSPIRRYIDIIVHRCLVAVLNRKALSHDPEDLTRICHDCNLRSFSAREFELQSHALKLAVQIKDHPLRLHAVVERLGDKNIQIGFKHDCRASKSVRKASLQFNLLKPIVRPEVSAGGRAIVMRWKERLYHTSGMPMLTAHDIRANQSRSANLQIAVNHRFTVGIPAHHWKLIMEAIESEDLAKVKRLLQEAERLPDLNARVREKESISPENGNVSVEDVTCETNSASNKLRHYVGFEHTFEVGDVVEVQLHPAFTRGLLSPAVQLYQGTPTLAFCTEHRSQPVQCFSEVADNIPNRKDIITYQETWRPIIDMMSAYNAVQQNETVVIHGVKIEWQYYEGFALPSGSFTLSKKFCDDRQIKISRVKEDGKKAAFLCIRYCTHDKNHDRLSDGEGGVGSESTFVAHASTIDIKEQLNKTDWTKSALTIFFEVNQMSGTFPKVLRKSGRQPKECTVEVIPVLYPDR